MLHQVAELVHDDVIDAVLGSLDQLWVEGHPTGGGALQNSMQCRTRAVISGARPRGILRNMYEKLIAS